MRLIELVVRRMPGIEDPFRLGEEHLGQGMHVVHGPNGVGKTALCHAAHALLWPGSYSERGISVEVRFENDGHVWFGSRTGSSVEWQRDGGPSGPPEMPDEHLARCFLVTVDDLYDRDRDGSWFAERVRREMAGGYDVRAVQAALFERGTQHGRSEQRTLDEARKLVRERERKQEQVLAEERDLGGLESELEEARAAAAELDALRAARDLVGARSRLAGARKVLEGLPPATARLAGNEAGRVEELEKLLEDLRSKLRELDRRERTAREAHSAARMDAEVSKAAIDEHRERLDVLRERERELREVRACHGTGLKRLEGLRAKLGKDADLGKLFAAPVPDLEQIERLVRDAQLLARERDELSGRLAALGSPQESRTDGEILAAGARALGGWLRAPASPGRRPSSWGVLAVALSAVISILVGILVHPLGFALLVTTVLLAWALMRVRPGSDARAAFVYQFAGTRLELPSAWEIDAVDRRREELESERARLRAVEQEEFRRKEVMLKLPGLEAREREVAERRETVRSTLGVLAPASDLALADLASVLVEMHKAHADVLAAEGRAEALSSECDGLLEVLSAYAHQHGEEPSADATALGHALGGIERRSGALREADAELRRVDRERAERDAELTEPGALRAKLFEHLDLEVGNTAGLAQLLELRGSRQEAEASVLKAVGEVRALESRLEGAQSITVLDAAEIEARLARAQEQVARRDELVGRIAEIRRGVRDARVRSDLEDALALQEVARASLEEACDDALHAEAGRLLLEEVEREHDRLSRPAVLSRAGELFAAFTGHLYGLNVAEINGEPVLRATDTTRPGVGLDPEQLSSGTRAQLLLAVRLAFAGQAERGSRLPVFVDDALATSDPDRVRAIARSLFTIAREEGRQVIVLTKDEGDLTLVQSVAAGEPLRVIDLAAVRRVQGAAARRERLELPTPRRVPAPEGRDGSTYAQALGVPPLDPWRAFDEEHLFHLLPDDPELLHHLLTWGVERVGPLRSMLDSGISFSLEAGERGTLEGWTRMAMSIHQSWRTGRGTPLTREALRECPSISSKFRERVESLAEELAWDAQALVDGLLERRIERFQESKARETRDWLEERGHISPEEPLTRDQAWGRVLSELDGLEPAQRSSSEILLRRFDYLWDHFAEGTAG